MSKNFTRTALATVVALVLVTPAFAQGDPLAAADAAFAAGDQPKALQLYDAVLASDAQNLRALSRSAQLLSWTGKFDEAIARYDRVLQLTPDDRIALLERSKMQSWTKRYDPAIAGFRRLVQLDASNREAQLALARTLSWSGRLTEARREYQVLLASNAQDADALTGVAQTYAWGGDSRTARRWYERALAADSGSLPANLGMAYVELAEGNRASASRRAVGLTQQYPNDADVRALNAAIRTSRQPRFELSHDALEDSDNNDLGISRFRAAFPAASRVELSAIVARYAMDSGVRDGSVDTAHLQTTFRVAPNVRFTLRGGVDRSERSNGSRRNTTTGSASLAAGAEQKLLFVALADRDTFKYSVPILDASIDVDTVGARFTHASQRWIIDGGAAYADFSDDNTRMTADGTILYRWPARALSIDTGYSYRYLDFDHSSFHGYFDPQNYNAHSLQLRIGHRFTSGVEFHVTGEGGLQSFEHRGVKKDNDRFAAGTAILTFPLGRMLLLDLSAAKSQSAISAASGFESTQYGVRLRVQQQQ